MSEDKRTNVLTSNRRQFTARQSMDAIISFARDQDEKIFNRFKRYSWGKFIVAYAIFALPIAYAFHSVTNGYWRSIYTTNLVSTPIEAVEGNVREYFVPEMFLKERQIRKIELGLKDTDELKTLFRKRPEA